ncbi:MAG: RNA polymerase sigma factor [Flavobacteriales bacterium]|nr:RNA polymerase sigma factor [Flavobacteriales bacterium]
MTTKEYNESVKLYADRVFRFIVKSTEDEALAKDITQDAYVKLWENHKELDASKARSWLFTTSYRIMIDGIRRAKKMKRMDDNTKEPGHEEHWTDLQEVLHDALGKLPEIQRQVILLRDYEGYSYEEIGEITALNESQVKVYIFRGRKKLKEYLVGMEHLI